MTAYYNEIDPYAAQWLRNLIAAGLIPAGDVDERSIADVQPGELAGYVQCHFFAGLGGWCRALRLAGWSDDTPVWTGSCPCQPFSAAGKRKGFDDERHLWPEWLRLIRVRRPPIVFGEQVAKAAGWLALVRGDLETMDYAVGCLPIEAASAGANHRRDRFWFVADAGSSQLRHEPRRGCGESGTNPPLPRNDGAQGPMADTNGSRWPQGNGDLSATGHGHSIAAGGGDVAYAAGNGRQQRWPEPIQPWETGRIAGNSWWHVEPDVGRVAHGIPGRVAKLRALGNAIVPQVAAEFITAACDVKR